MGWGSESSIGENKKHRVQIRNTIIRETDPHSCGQEWVMASLESGDWVDEEPYEMTDFSPAVKALR